MSAMETHRADPGSEAALLGGNPSKTPPPRRRRHWVVGGVATVGVLLVIAVVVVFAGPARLLVSGDRVELGDGRSMFVRCSGSGSPTVILEHGLGADGSDWKTVQDAVDDMTRVCFRSRAGRGFSDPISDKTILTAHDAADDLDELLQVAGIEGPYIVVGHSFGGYVVRLFAARHPDEVVGVVLVDSSHPDQPRRLRDRLSAETWNDMSTFFQGSQNPEKMDLEASAAQVAASGALGDRPLVVLHANQQKTDAGAAGIKHSSADELDAVMAGLWPELQADLATLSSSGRLVPVEDSGHFIHLDRPRLVSEAILSVLNESPRS